MVHLHGIYLLVQLLLLSFFLIFVVWNIRIYRIQNSEQFNKNNPSHHMHMHIHVVIIQYGSDHLFLFLKGMEIVFALHGPKPHVCFLPYTSRFYNSKRTERNEILEYLIYLICCDIWFFFFKRCKFTKFLILTWKKRGGGLHEKVNKLTQVCDI